MWPSGTFALSRPKLGCPESNDFDWKVGWRFQDTEDTNPRNGRSESFHLDADVELSRGSYVNRSFCNKEKDSYGPKVTTITFAYYPHSMKMEIYAKLKFA